MSSGAAKDERPSIFLDTRVIRGLEENMRRSRTRTNLGPVTETWRIAVNGASPDTFKRNVEWFSHYSVMSDGIHGNDEPKPNRPDSDCAHVKITTTGKMKYTDPPLVYTGAGLNRFDITPPTGNVCFSPSQVPDLPSSIHGDSWKRFVENAFEEFTEQFNDSVSLANFVIELTDFRSALLEAKKLFFGALGHGGGFFRSIGNFLHDRAKNGIGGNFLDIELNWKSLVQDIPKIWDAYSTTMKRLEFLVGHQRFHTHRRSRYMIEPSTQGFDPVEVGNLGAMGPLMGTYKIWLRPAQCQVTYNASAYIENRLQLQDISTWWALADSLGLNNSPKIVWNAVKLSWVADMFVDTSGFFEAFEVEAYNGKLVVSGGNASVKVVRFYDVVLEYPMDDDIPYTTKEEVVGSMRVVDYTRGPLNLIRPSLLGLKKSLNNHQQALLSSLGDAKLGLTSGLYNFTSEYVSNFKKNNSTFGKSYWKRIPRSRKR